MECDSKEKERQELAKNIADAKKSEENARLEHAKVVADFQHKISSSKVYCFLFCFVLFFSGGGGDILYTLCFFLWNKSIAWLTHSYWQKLIINLWFSSLVCNNLYQKKIFLAVFNKLFKTCFSIAFDFGKSNEKTPNSKISILTK